MSIVTKVTSAHLMKPGAKRRRSKVTIEEDRRRAAAEHAAVAAKFAELEQFRANEEAFLQKKQRLESNDELVKSMFREGVLKTEPNGTITAVKTGEEQARLKEENQIEEARRQEQRR